VNSNTNSFFTEGRHRPPVGRDGCALVACIQIAARCPRTHGISREVIVSNSALTANVEIRHTRRQAMRDPRTVHARAGRERAGRAAPLA